MSFCKSRRPVQYFEFNDTYVQELRAGDPATTEHFFRYFRTAIERSLRARAYSIALIEDIQQETFIRVLRALQRPGSIEQPDRFGAYVLSISQNVLHEHLRKTRGATVEPDDTQRDTRPDPEVLAQSAQFRDRFRRVLATMSQVDRSILIAIAQDKTHDEISRELNLKPACIRVRLHRARMRLRQRLTTKMEWRCAPVKPSNTRPTVPEQRREPVARRG
jgi:RNA polymerase sigma-70 factor (ECF subfamily)